MSPKPNELVMSIVIGDYRHYVKAAGLRGWRVACTDEKVPRRDLVEVRAVHIYCPRCRRKLDK